MPYCTCPNQIPENISPITISKPLSLSSPLTCPTRISEYMPRPQLPNYLACHQPIFLSRVSAICHKNPLQVPYLPPITISKLLSFLSPITHNMCSPSRLTTIYHKNLSRGLQALGYRNISPQPQLQSHFPFHHPSHHTYFPSRFNTICHKDPLQVPQPSPITTSIPLSFSSPINIACVLLPASPLFVTRTFCEICNLFGY